MVYIVSGIFILMWIYRANYNARQLGGVNMKFTPGWSIGWYFIPIVNLWKPYQAMKEIWQVSHRPDDWQSVEVAGTVSTWWAVWIINGIVANAAFRASLRLEGIDGAITTNILYLVSDVGSVLLALVTLPLISTIYRAQRSHALSRNEPPATLSDVS